MKYRHIQAGMVQAFNREADEKAFAAGMKYFRTAGIPDGVNVGRGKPAHYGEKEIRELGLALALSRFNIDPKLIAIWIKKESRDFAKACKDADGSLESLYLAISIDFMRADPELKTCTYDKPIKVLTRDEYLAQHLPEDGDLEGASDFFTWLTIDLTALFARVWHYINLEVKKDADKKKEKADG